MARVRRRLAGVVAGVVATTSLVGVVGGAGAPAGALTPSEEIALGVTGGRALVVDDATGRVFVAADDQVLVRAADGSALATIEDVDGAASLATGLGSVWALAAGTSVIVRIDPATAAVVDSIPVRGATGLVGLAVADGAVWTTGTASGGGTVLVEVASEAPIGAFRDTAHALPAGTDRLVLDASPGAPDLLVGGEITDEALAFVFDVGGEAPEVQATRELYGPVVDLAVNHDGSEVTIVGFGSSYSTADLSEIAGSRPSDAPYGSWAVARRLVGDADVVALGGYMLTGVFSWAPLTTVHQDGQTAPSVVVSEGGSAWSPFPWTVQEGMAISPDGERLYILESPPATNADPTPDDQVRIVDMVPAAQDVSPRVVGTIGGGSVGVHGSDLWTATATVGGQPATSVDSWPNPSFQVPALPVGEADLVLTRLGLVATASEAVVVRDLGPFRDTAHYLQRMYGDFAWGASGVDRIPAVDADLAAGGSLGELPAWFVAGRGGERPDASLLRLYEAMFLRPADLPGLRYWQGRRDAGRSLTWVASAMAASPEFTQRYGTLSNAAFVDRIYLNVLGRPAEPAGKTYWTRVLASGQPRGKVVLHFAGSPEYRARTAPNLHVFSLYETMLQRAPRSAEMAAALEVVRTSGLAAVAAGMIASPEYIARVEAIDPPA